MKAKLITILLILVLIGPALVTLTWLKAKKSAVKREVKWRVISGIDNDELELLKFSIKETDTKLRWEHAKEFEYNEEMYDVVKTQIVGDSVYYWCWWDHEETKLNRQLSQVVNDLFGNSQQKREKQNRLISYLNSLYCNDLNDWNFLAQLNLKEHFSIESNLYVSIKSDLQTPPPRLV